MVNKNAHKCQNNFTTQIKQNQPQKNSYYSIKNMHAAKMWNWKFENSKTKEEALPCIVKEDEHWGTKMYQYETVEWVCCYSASTMKILVGKNKETLLRNKPTPSAFFIIHSDFLCTV